jgi:uncharacterized repeat protein (TIGR01451 family)
VEREHSNLIRGGRASLALTLVLSACTPPNADPGPTERVGGARSRVFVNGDFEAGIANTPPLSWIVTSFLDPGVTPAVPQTLAGLNLGVGGLPLTFTLLAPGGAGSQIDPSLGAGASLRWPRYGSKVAIVNQLGKAQNVNSLKQTMTVAAADLDSVDGLAHIRFVLAPVLEDPMHTPEQQPYYFVRVDNVTRGLTLYQDYNASAQPGVPWKVSNGFYYTDWQLVDVAPGSDKVAVGDLLSLEIIASGCSLGEHFGQVYVDGVGSVVPGPFVTATGPAAANAGSNITYTLTYKNGGAAGAGGTTVEFNTPPGTTFQAIGAGGLTCTTPLAGAGGQVSCAVGTLAAGAGGSFTVTVLIDPVATGTITAGNYDIFATTVTPLLGPKVNTLITEDVSYADLGITITNGLSSLAWGQAVTYSVVASNAGPNAVVGATVSDPVPVNLTGVTWTCVGSGGGTCAAGGIGGINDGSVALPVGAHVTYTVTGAVASGSGSGALANLAGLTLPLTTVDPNPANNGAGDVDPILSPNGIACTESNDCVSAVCDADDHKCGFAVGDGPCTAVNAGVVCRSGMCSVGGFCEPSGGCNVDLDCTGGAWCDISAHVCTPQIANGGALPTDTGHLVPTLNGKCTPEAAALVCVSGVCDVADDLCGFAIGDGPCTGADGGVVCRSTLCAILAPNLGTCVGCQTDEQCPGTAPVCDGKELCVQCTPAKAAACIGATPICAAGTETCVPCAGDLGAGTAGDCPTPAEPYCFLTGASAGECGKCTMNADCVGHPGGPICDTASGACGVACHSDADCDDASWCNAPTGGSGLCVSKLDNGTKLPATPVNVATCTPVVGMRVCKSGVCDPIDDTCGLANGDGPCGDGMVCRSGACEPTDGKCGRLPTGPCTSDAVCRAGSCDVATNTCAPTGCKVDDDCATGDFCKSDGVCTPKRPDGQRCTASNQCLTDACDDQICDGLTPSGGTGLTCAAGAATGSGSGPGAGLLGLMLAAAGLARRRRR